MEKNAVGNLDKSYIQLCGFTVGGGLYSIPVLDVQEVIRPSQITPVPLADHHLKGLLNLRGQIVTAISLRSLFGLEPLPDNAEYMNVIVRSGDSLYALIVDEIKDVIDVNAETYEKTPDNLSESLSKYIDCVYKLDKQLLIKLNLNNILDSETE